MKATVRDFKKKSETGYSFPTVTAYDATMASLVELAEIPLILVGDSVGMTQLGFNTTLLVTVEMILHHTQAVRRGAPNTFVVSDMPFGSYHTSVESALKNAIRLIQEGGADAVKLEGGATMAPLIRKMVETGIPVMAHIGLLPQHVITKGGYFLRGKTSEDRELLMQDALAVAEAGAFCVVLEGVVPAFAEELTHALKIPTIGIASGPLCDTQIQVLNDLIHLSTKPLPRHARPYCNVAESVLGALKQYHADVKAGTFGKDA